MSETFAVPDSLSPSSTSTFQTCPLQFRFQNIQKLPQPPSAAAVKGNVVHRALELLFGLDAPNRTPQAAHQFLAQAKTEFEPTYDITGLNLSEVEAAKFWADCTVLVDKYLQMEDPQTINNIDVELWVTAPLQGFLLRGFIDRVERDANGGIVISDYKTGKAPRANDVDNKMTQLHMYAYMLNEMRGEMPASIQLMYIKDGVHHHLHHYHDNRHHLWLHLLFRYHRLHHQNQDLIFLKFVNTILQEQLYLFHPNILLQQHQIEQLLDSQRMW